MEDAGQGGVVAPYFFESEISALVARRLLRPRGILLESQPIVDDVVFADTLLEELGDRAVAVQVGEFRAR